VDEARCPRVADLHNDLERRPAMNAGSPHPASLVAKVDPTLKVGGKWNTDEITMQGKRLVLVLNGQKTVDIEGGEFAGGPVALQWGRGTIRRPEVEIRSV
jgi:hypothetical protein